MRAFLAGLLLSVAASADTLVALNEQGIAHLRAGRAQAAVDAFEAALAKSPGSTVLKRNTAAALAAFAESKRKQELPDEAIDALDRAIELRPRSPQRERAHCESPSPRGYVGCAPPNHSIEPDRTLDKP